MDIDIALEHGSLDELVACEVRAHGWDLPQHSDGLAEEESPQSVSLDDVLRAVDRAAIVVNRMAILHLKRDFTRSVGVSTTVIFAADRSCEWHKRCWNQIALYLSSAYNRTSEEDGQ